VLLTPVGPLTDLVIGLENSPDNLPHNAPAFPALYALWHSAYVVGPKDARRAVSGSAEPNDQ
jgi:hypothetical protein